MNISNVASFGTSFGRALTTNEQKEFAKLQSEAKQKLKIDKTTATIFDFSVPTSNKDTGIGTSFSQDAQNLAEFLKTMCGVNSIQIQPQGEISNMIRSPYSGTGFSLGMHIIDLSKLTNDSYAELLTAEDLDSSYMNRVTNHDSVDYENVFSEDGQKSMLQKAYAKFTQLDESHPLKKEFSLFKKENEYWLEKDSLYEAAAVANSSQDMRTWTERDQNVFASKAGDAERIAQLKYVEDEQGNNVVDFNEFIQFIAAKQQKEAKDKFNAKGIDVYGDCQIGFSQKDYWAHKSAFYPTLEFGCDIGNGNHSCWSPAIDFSKIDGDAGELLYNKFNLFFKRYNGVRIDAAWQLIKPLICEPIKNNGQDVFDGNGNKLGHKIGNQPNVGGRIIRDIVLRAADENRVPRHKVFLELLGGNSYDCLDDVKNSGAELIHITKYASDSWGRVKYYEATSDNKYQNMKPGEYTIGPGTHDDETLIEQVGTYKGRIDGLAHDLHLNPHELRNSPENFSKAIWAELFTTSNQFATLPDILGTDRRINLPNTTNGNWSYRAPKDYEREYFTNLSQGKGLNLADALSKAIKAKQHGHGSELTNRLEHFAHILRQDGPMTRKEADKVYA